MTSNPYFTGANVVSLTGIPLDGVPPPRLRTGKDHEILNQLSRQLGGLQMEVHNLHQFAEFMDEHGDDVLQGVAQQIAVVMRHFDTRLHEMESCLTELCVRAGRRGPGHAPPPKDTE